MSEAWAWLQANWWAAIVAFFAMVQIVNAATDRWDEYVGPGWKRVLLLLTEMGSILTSKGYDGFWKVLKLPLNPYGGSPGKPDKPSFPPSSALFVLLVGGVVLATLEGCAPSFVDKANQSISAAHELARGGWSTARPILQERCQAALAQCDPSDSMTSCPPYMSCYGLRRDIETAFVAVQTACAKALDALSVYERLKDSTDASEGPVVTEKQLAEKRASVQERIDRAHREAIELLRRLTQEGLVHADD